MDKHDTAGRESGAQADAGLAPDTGNGRKPESGEGWTSDPATIERRDRDRPESGAESSVASGEDTAGPEE